MKDIAAKRLKEQCVVEEMIRLYCKHNHKDLQRNHNGMCEECYELAEYAKSRFVITVRFIATNRKCLPKSKQLCAIRDRGCCFIIRS